MCVSQIAKICCCQRFHRATLKSRVLVNMGLGLAAVMAAYKFRLKSALRLLLKRARPALLLRRALMRLPKPIRHRIYRRMIKLTPPPSNIVFRLAETQKDLEGAFKLLHE